MKTLITVALTTHLIPGRTPIPPKLWRELRTVVGNGAGPEDTAEHAKRILSPADSQRVADCLNDLASYQEALDSLANEDVRCLTEFDEAYPQNWIRKLSGKHPAAIFASGNLDLLNTNGIGIVGSRDVDDAGARFASAVAEESVRLGYAVISGGAKGVDQIAAEAALSAGGAVIEIVPDSLLKRVHAGLAGSSRTLATPYHPDAGFSAGNAMGRNKLIYALSKASVVVASSLGSGGTWTGAREAILQRLCPVLVRSAENAPVGNRALVELGGTSFEAVRSLEQVIGQEPSRTLF